MLPAVFLQVLEGFPENTDLAIHTTLEKEGQTECFRETRGHSGF